jgi:oligosaccharide reducing-end xylanase
MTQEESDAKVQAGFDQLFHGGNNQNVYYESGDEAYILDVNSNDVRSEGQSYGMMIAVQLDKKQEFDAIWRWSKRVMQHDSGLFGWHATTGGQLLSSGSAPDGEEYFAMSLIFASHRWGNDTGIDYMAEAQAVLRAMYDEELFDHGEKLVKFVQTSNYTDPSYILPAFYELYACVDEDPTRAQFWKDAASVGRAFLQVTCHPTTGLAPYQANYDGSARNGFNADSYRVVGNIMMDHYLFGVDPWQTTFAANYAAFFEVNQQSNQPGAEFSLDGNATVSYGSPEAALAAQNGTVAIGVPAEQGRYFLEYLWDMPVPSGQYRYYAGMLYLLALLHVSGNFQVY